MWPKPESKALQMLTKHASYGGHGTSPKLHKAEGKVIKTNPASYKLEIALKEG